MDFGKINHKRLADYIGYKPNKIQKIISRADSRFKVVMAGRRSGKTKYVTEDPKDGAVVDLITPNQYVWIVAPNYDLTQRIWIPLVQFARGKFSNVIKRIWDTKGAFRIDTYFNTIIEAKSAEEPQKLVGAGLTKLLGDEFNLWKKKTWFESLRPTLIGTKEIKVGKAIFIGTPKGKNWGYDLWQNDTYPIDRPYGIDGQGISNLTAEQLKKKEWASFRFTTFDNEFLDEKEVQKLIKDMPEYEYRQEILSEFEETAEQLFRRIRDNIRGELIREKRLGQEYSMGMDLGRKGAYSVICIINKKTGHLDYFDRFRKVSWAIQIERAKHAIEKFNPYPITMDATGIGDPVVEDLEKVVKKKVQSFIFTEVSKKQLMDKLAIWVEKGLVSYPEIPQLLLEMERYGRQIMESGVVKYKSIGSITSDCVVALALAVWPLREYSNVPAETFVFEAPKY